MSKMSYKNDEGKKQFLMPEICFRSIASKDERYRYTFIIDKVIESMYCGSIDRFLADVEKVLDYGIKKYGKKNSWQEVPYAQMRYYSAMMRHYMSEDAVDAESGISHKAHMSCNLVFLLWFEIQEVKL